MKHPVTKFLLSVTILLGLTPQVTPILAAPKAQFQTHKIDSQVTFSPQTREQVVLEINFLVRSFLCALDGRRAALLAKLASPSMRSEFADAHALMTAMTRAHAPVIGAKNIFLHLPDVKKNIAVQTVFLDDRKGRPWKATYILHRDIDGRFGIIGCVVKRLKGKLV